MEAHRSTSPAVTRSGPSRASARSGLPASSPTSGTRCRRRSCRASSPRRSAHPRRRSGLIEGIADGAAGVARFAGGPLADDPHRRRTSRGRRLHDDRGPLVAIGVATAAWQVGLMRSVAWTARGLRVPARNALLADLAPASAYGRAYGFERSMDNLGAIGRAAARDRARRARRRAHRDRALGDPRRCSRRCDRGRRPLRRRG